MVWGVGQTFLLTCAYTRLGETRISLGIDDNARRAEASVAFPVVTSRTATQRLTEQDAVLFTFAPRSEQKALLGELRIPYFSFSL